MKNKLIFLIIGSFFFYNIANSNTFKFDTKKIEIFKDQNKIIAGKGKAYTDNKNLEIYADNFEYLKDLDILKSNGNGLAILNSKNIEIEFDSAIFDQSKSTIEAFGNVLVKDMNKNIIIETDKVIYNQKKNLITSDNKTILKDDFQNLYLVDSFEFEIDKDILKVTNLIFNDKEDNTVRTNLAYINTASGKLFGKDVNVDLNNSAFDEENEPRLKGNSINHDNNSSEITKGVFTTCKKNDNCPPWKISAEKIQHDKKNKIINYKNAFLNIYDVPVMYFPRFFHPDPTVKRKSGFLIPSIKNSKNSDNYLNTPYFFAIAENRDATFYPRFYPDEKFLLQTEYRQVNENSNQIMDFSFFAEKGKKIKNHFLYEYGKYLDFTNFEESKIDLVAQHTSDDTYLKLNKLEQDEIDLDKNILENSLDLNLYSNDLSINLNTTVYEDLVKDNSDRYEYIFPKLDIIKNFNNNTDLNGSFTLKSQNLIRNYNTNVYERKNINDVIFSSNPKINSLGFYNNYEFIVKNTNSNNKNSEYKNKDNLYLSSLFQYNSSLPLIKENDKYQKILKPKFAFKLAPSHTKDESSKEVKIDMNNIYSVNRTSNQDTVEGGASLVYGTEYSILDKEDSRDLFSLKLANNFRFENNDDLPSNNQIGEKTSNLFSEITYNPNNFIKTNYNSSLKNNLKDISYENLIAEFKVNNLVTTFDYINENNTSKKNTYISNKTEFSFDESNSLAFSTRKNKSSDLTEYYNFMYQYKNDCLSASIEYNKDYYSDRELKPDEGIFFKLTIIPFGETSSPNFKN